MELKNHTRFAAAHVVVFAKDASEHMVVTLKGSYKIRENGMLELLEVQPPVRAAEEFNGEPGVSSIRYESELGPAKPATDVALVGKAYAPTPDTKQMEVALRVGPVQKAIRVFGNRVWKKFMGMYSASSPEAFECISLIYENAFGGKDTSAEDAKDHAQEERNPVGRGFRAKKSKLDLAGKPMPNLESASGVTKGRSVEAFGFIGRDWQPRLRYAGTYNEQWLQDRIPFLPLDFDDRFHNAAHPDLVAPGHLSGNEPVEVAGCTRSGRLAFQLPNVQPRCAVNFHKSREELAMKLNTVLIDTETLTLSLLWKAEQSVHRLVPQIASIECRA